MVSVEVCDTGTEMTEITWIFARHERSKTGSPSALIFH
jgi:hypothetical protein